MIISDLTLNLSFKALSPNIVTLEVTVSTYEFGGSTITSIIPAIGNGKGPMKLYMYS